MGKVKDWDSGTTFTVAFPRQKMDEYLKRIAASSEKELTFEQVRIVFRFALDDFFHGYVFLEEMSEVGETLWWRVIELNRHKTDKEFWDLLHFAGEMSYCVRFHLKITCGL
jgi:hypothetical protein